MLRSFVAYCMSKDSQVMQEFSWFRDPPSLPPKSTNRPDFFAPKKNHFGFLWLASTIGLLVGFPLYLRHTYKPTITFLFNARNGTIFRNNVLVTRFRRVESIRVHEHGDPTGRFLYALSLLHTDGHEQAIYEVYEERDALTLANEIATYVKRPVTFK